jgi:hypothetical protein
MANAATISVSHFERVISLGYENDSLRLMQCTGFALALVVMTHTCAETGQVGWESQLSLPLRDGDRSATLACPAEQISAYDMTAKSRIWKALSVVSDRELTDELSELIAGYFLLGLELEQKSLEEEGRMEEWGAVGEGLAESSMPACQQHQ